MEDEDVDSVNALKVLNVENDTDAVDDPLAIKKDVKKILLPDNNSSNLSEEENDNSEENRSINRLKNSLINHDTDGRDSCEEVPTSPVELINTSPQKVNGELDKNENTASLEESCDNDEHVKEELKSNSSRKSSCSSSNNDDEEEEEEEGIKGDDDANAEKSNKRKHSLSGSSEESNITEDDFEDDESSSDSSPVEFRGFKRRKKYEMEKEKMLNICEVKRRIESLENDVADEETTPDGLTESPKKAKSVELRRSMRNTTVSKKCSSEDEVPMEAKEEGGDQLTEYAQYLGLQPTVKFKCGRCGEKHFQSMATLNAHQMICCKTGSNTLTKQIKPTCDSSLSTNFRITRKVYLCSACGTYYENWKLFLHMRDMHKRHICLFCLGMFSVAERLAEHLLYQHNVHEKTCKSPEEFLNLFKGSCYLTCCSCEKMFTEREDFYDHQCKDSIPPNPANWNADPTTLTAKDIKELAQKCTLCGVKCGHFRTCPKVAHKFQNVSASSSSSTSGANTPNNSNISLEKFYIPVPANVQKNWTPTNLNQDILKQALSFPPADKDYYDVSSVASFCHVDMANDSDNQGSPEKNPIERRNFDRKTTLCKHDNHKSPPRLSNDEVEKIEEVSQNDEDDDANNSVKSLPTDNFNSVSDDSNNSDSRHDLKIDEKQDDEIMKRISDHECSDKFTMDEDKTSIKEPVDVSANSSEDSCISEDDDDNKSNEITDDVTETSDKIQDKHDDLPSCSKLDRMNDDTVCNGSISTRDDISQSDPNSKSSSIDSDNSRSSMETDNNDDVGVQIDDQTSTNLETDDISMKEISMEDTNKAGDSETDEKEPDDDDDVEDDDHKAVLELDNAISSNLSHDSSDSVSENSSSQSKKFEGSGDEMHTSLSNDENNRKENDSTEDVTTVDEMKDVSLDDEVTNQSMNESCDGMVDDETQETKSENEATEEEEQKVIAPPKEMSFKCDGVNVQLASEEVMAMALTLENKMESLSSQSVVKECVRTSCTTCSYCSHAIKIGVNGKQLALHLLMEHRYMPVKNETIEDVIERLKNSLDELKDVWFNTDSYDSSDKSCFEPYDHTYECFQCNYVTNTHKDLFSHKRKVHQKTILYCSMCKENFYSYSELLCHMCPGLYDATKDIHFRCCLCDSDRIPSAFRLMVHLRKTHHTCDICLEVVDDQQKLSAHMVKHKLHHLCYRCGIAYRNKPDITKHLFWKHGTESVVCKRCLQKKWPHVYHFCVPPPFFTCDECHISFTKAVYLKVHRRFHDNVLPYACTKCEQKFVSQKLLVKHDKTHETANVEESVNNSACRVEECGEKSIEQNETKSNETLNSSVDGAATTDQQVENEEKSNENAIKSHKKKSKKDKEKKIKPVVDVYDLPPLNLSSESDDTDDEKEGKPTSITTNVDNQEKNELLLSKDDVKESDEKVETVDNEIVDKSSEIVSETKTTESNPVESMDIEESAQPVTVVDGIWDNFHTYKAEQEKRGNLDSVNKESSQTDSQPLPSLKDTVLGDHDYCKPTTMVEPARNPDSNEMKPKEHSSSIDHDYCTQNSLNDNSSAINASGVLNTSAQSDRMETPSKKKQKSPKKKTPKQHNSSSSSDSSSDSDSSSCSCGTNCSCSSSSSNSSSSCSSDSDSSSSDGKHNNSNSKRERKKEKLKNKRKGEVVKPSEPTLLVDEQVVNVALEPEEPLIQESDLDTDESVTDEEFYDKYPQMRANQILAEKRNQLMVLATVAPTVNNGTVSPPVPNTTPNTNINLDPISSPKLEIVTPPVTPTVQTQNKRKMKTKKRRKSSFGATSKSRSKPHGVPPYETQQPSTSFGATTWQPSLAHVRKMTSDNVSMYVQPQPPVVPAANMGPANVFSTPHLTNRKSNADMDSSKRFSKRRRIRNKFYGYSSDEDGEHHQAHPPLKWKKPPSVDPGVKHNVMPIQPYPQPYQQPVNVVHPEYNHSYQQQSLVSKPLPHLNVHRPMFNENQVSESAKRSAPSSSSDSDADSDSDNDRLAIDQQVSVPSVVAANMNAVASEKDDKLYCYCQCPYDEVSEMIACDGIDCTIEWFHFECVGIMVPPKGKWYCPDCRKRRGLS